MQATNFLYLDKCSSVNDGVSPASLQFLDTLARVELDYLSTLYNRAGMSNADIDALENLDADSLFWFHTNKVIFKTLRKMAIADRCWHLQLRTELEINFLLTEDIDRVLGDVMFSVNNTLYPTALRRLKEFSGNHRITISSSALYEIGEDVSDFYSKEQKKSALISIAKNLEDTASQEEKKEGTVKDIDAFKGFLLDLKTKVAVIPTGFKRLDNAIDGLLPKELIVIGGRPGSGKTSLGLNIFDFVRRSTALRDSDKPAVFFSLEMTRSELIARSISALTGTRVNLSSDFLSISIEKAINSYRLEMSNIAPTYWSEPATCNTIDSIVEESRRIAKLHSDEHNTPQMGAIFIDYLQLIQTSGKSKDRHLEVAEITRKLKLLAIELNCPIVAFAQLNRDSAKKSVDNSRPTVAELRESGSIEQDADMVLLVHRPELYALNDQDSTRLKGSAEILVAKNRRGPRGVLKCRFQGEFSRFTEDTTSMFDYI